MHCRLEAFVIVAPNKACTDRLLAGRFHGSRSGRRVLSGAFRDLYRGSIVGSGQEKVGNLTDPVGSN